VVQREEPREEDDGEPRLDHQGGDDDHPDQGADLPEALRLGLRRGEKALREPEAPGDGQAEDGRERHDPEAAHLDPADDDRLAEGGPVRRRVHHGEAGDADGRGCGEKGVERADSRRSLRDRQAQQNRADQDQARKGARQKSLRTIEEPAEES